MINENEQFFSSKKVQILMQILVECLLFIAQSDLWTLDSECLTNEV